MVSVSVKLALVFVHVIFPGIKKPETIKEIFKTKAERIFGESFPKIITVARLDKRKGHDKILMLIKNLKSKSWYIPGGGHLGPGGVVGCVE